MATLFEIAPWQHETFTRFLNSKGHAYLLTGSKGLGQFELAVAMGASMLCEASTPHKENTPMAAVKHACGHCAACKLLSAKTHPDLMVLMPEILSLELNWPLDEKSQSELDGKKRKPSQQIKLDAVQNLIDFAQRTGSRGQKLVAIIYPANAMNHIAANALLKILEEPLGNIYFILVPNNSSSLLPTIKSRCQTLLLPNPSIESAQEWLVNQGVPAENVGTWLKAAAGEPLTALALSQTLMEVHYWLDFPKYVRNSSGIDGFPPAFLDKPTIVIDALYKLCHDAACIKLGMSAQFFDTNLVKSEASLHQLLDWNKSLSSAIEKVSYSFNQQLMIELLLAEAHKVMADH